MAKVLKLDTQYKADEKPFNIKEHLREINKGFQIKLRAKAMGQGKFSFYLEHNIKGEQRRKYLYLYYQNNQPKENKKVLALAKKIQRREQDIYDKNKHGYDLENNRLEASFISYFIDQMNRPDRGKSDRKNWKSAFNHLNRFLNGRDILFYEVTKEFCNNFASYLKSELSPNTAHKYFGIFKSAILKAVDENIFVKSPAQFITISREPSKREFLTLDEIKKLKNTPCPNEQTKRAFLFSCFTGLRISDIKKLTWEEVQDGYINFTQQKTNGMQRLKLASSAAKIFEMQLKETAHPKLVFDLITADKSLKHLHKWAKDAGIKKKVTWHVGRHTFATLALSSGVDIYTVSKLLGHTDVKVTQIYAKLIDSEKDKAIDKLPEI